MTAVLPQAPTVGEPVPQPLPPGPTRHGCQVKTCCSRGASDVTGADMVRIATTLAVEPWQFTQTAPAAADDPTGIVVDGGRRRVVLRLANAAHGCVFLLRTPNGPGFCGLDETAPISCRLFPADPRGGGSVVRDEPGCECRTWTDHDIDPARSQRLSDQWAADHAHWNEMISRWNALADSTTEASDIEDFQRYMIEAQLARQAGAGWPEEAGRER